MRKEEIAYQKGYRVTDEGVVLGVKGEPISMAFNHTKYLNFCIRINNRHKKVRVHRMQAYQKFGSEIYNPGIVVRHMDGIATNNHISNIKIGTQSENLMDMPKEVRLSKALYAASFIKKFDHEAVLLFYNECKSYKKTMEAFEIKSKSSLRYIIITDRKKNN